MVSALSAAPVVKVLGGGKASLMAMRYIIEDLVKAGVPILKPLGLDHDADDLAKNEFFDGLIDIKELLGRNGYSFGPEDCFVPIDGNLSTREGLRKSNPVFYELANIDDIGAVEMHDRPCVLAEWAKQHASEIWDWVLSEWRVYRLENHANNRLIILMPYCPEGPTSGTIGTVLGTMLRRQIEDAKNQGDLQNLTVRVYGLELCPSIPYQRTINDGTLRGNAYAGYIARKALLEGPVASRPFDACFAVDVGREEDLGLTLEESELHVDKAAARVGVAVVKGVLGQDLGESDDAIRQHWRWQVIPLEIWTDPSELKVLPYLTAFPTLSQERRDNAEGLRSYLQASNKLQAAFADDQIVKDAFEHCDIREDMINELKVAGEQWRMAFTSHAQFVRKAKSWIPFFKPSKQEVQQAYTKLGNVVAENQAVLDKLKQSVGPDNTKLSPKPLGYEVELGKREIQAYIQDPRPLAELMSISIRARLKNLITERVAGYLSKYIWDHDKSFRTELGSFPKIVATSVGASTNDQFLPTVGSLAIHTRDSSERSVLVQAANPSLARVQSDEESNLGCDIFVFAADAKLEDVSSYQDLVRVAFGIEYNEMGEVNEQGWEDYARYHIEAPPELMEIYNHRKDARAA